MMSGYFFAKVIVNALLIIIGAVAIALFLHQMQNRTALAKQQANFAKCAFMLYGKFLLWGIASLLLFMIGGALLLLGAEYLDGMINRGP